MAYIVIDSNLPENLDGGIRNLALQALTPLVDAAINANIIHENLTLTLLIEDTSRTRRNIGAVEYPDI